MISEVNIRNFGQIREFHTDQFSNLNLFIGENGTGKTTLLKAMYASAKTMEQYHRGDSIRSTSEILSEKMRWVFQAEKLKALVTKGEKSLSFSIVNNNESFDFGFSDSAEVKIINVTEKVTKTNANSVFIPAKEVLSLFSVILRAREVEGLFGFDDTYYDLVKALQIRPHRGRSVKVFADSRKALRDLLGGSVDNDEASGKWYFVNKRGQKFEISVTAEGVKKISILDRLLGNGYISNQSILFFDEVESALHPSAIYDFLDILDKLAFDMGIQIFIVSHSYFVIKKLYLIALKRKQSVMCYSLNQDGSYDVDDLQNGIPENSIVGESVRLYNEEINEELS